MIRKKGNESKQNQFAPFSSIVWCIRKSAFVLIFILNFSLNSYSQFVHPIGTTSLSMCGITTTLTNVWSSTNNPSCLGLIKNFNGGLFVENKYLLDELNLKAVGFALPVSKMVVGLNANHWGNRVYNNYNLTLACGKKLTDGFYLGISGSFDYLKINSEYPEKTFSANIGLRYNLTNTTELGITAFHLFHPTAIQLFRIGLAQKLDTKLYLHLELSKYSQLKTQPILGIVYQVKPTFQLSGGINTSARKISFGVQYEKKSLVYGFALASHPYLGFSPSVSIVYKK